MKTCKASENQTARRILLMAYVAALAVAFTGRADASGQRGHVTPPHVPANIEAPVGHKAYLLGHAVGTQNYVCMPSGAGFGWTFFGPQATLFDRHEKQITTHFLSSNPLEGGLARATWQHSADTSSVWAMATPATTSSDPAFVAPGAIPWLLLQVVGEQEGPDGGRKLTATTYIQRVNTSGGIVPSTGCAASADVGKKALVPYTADYFFYRYARHW